MVGAALHGRVALLQQGLTVIEEQPNLAGKNRDEIDCGGSMHSGRRVIVVIERRVAAHLIEIGADLAEIHQFIGRDFKRTEHRAGRSRLQCQRLVYGIGVAFIRCRHLFQLPNVREAAMGVAIGYQDVFAVMIDRFVDDHASPHVFVVTRHDTA